MGPESEASSGTDCTPGSSVRKKGLCGVQPGLLDELDEHIVAPEMEAGSSPPGHNDAGSAARSRRPSASEKPGQTSAPPETNSRVPASKGTFALTKRVPWSLTTIRARDVEAKTGVDETLNFCVKATGKDRVHKRQELVNMKPGDLQRCSERWQKRAQRKSSVPKKRRSKRCSSAEDKGA